MIDLSIIVPVYNVDKFLDRCLDSIFRQHTTAFFEVIAINDGSTDNSIEILNSYKARHNNMIIVNQEFNKSLAVARRTGIELARGVYVIHIDSDDWIRPNMFEDLFLLAKDQCYPDTIVYNYCLNDGKHEVPTQKKIKSFLCVNESEKTKYQHLFYGTCINKMVKRSLLRDLVYGLEYQNTTEDLIYATEVFIKSSRIVFTPITYYNYFVNEKSLTSCVTPDSFFKAQILVYRLLNIVRNKYDIDEVLLGKIGGYLDQWLLEQIIIHHCSDRKISIEVFIELSKSYVAFANYRKKLDLEKVYYSFVQCLKSTAESIGWLKTIKRVIYYRFYVRNIHN